MSFSLKWKTSVFENNRFAKKLSLSKWLMRFSCSFPPEKRRLPKSPVSRTRAPRKPLTPLPLQPPECVRTLARSHGDVIIKFSRLDGLTNNSYPWCSAINPISYLINGSSVVVGALASHQLGLDSIPGWYMLWVCG